MLDYSKIKSIIDSNPDDEWLTTSDDPDAHIFQRWLNHEVLPISIRFGSYIAPWKDEKRHQLQLQIVALCNQYGVYPQIRWEPQETELPSSVKWVQSIMKGDQI